MKKIFLSFALLLSIFAFAGCEKVESTDTNETVKGNYKEGTYFASTNYESYGTEFVTTAVIYVDENGVLKSVFIDSTYEKDEVRTTKKTLRDDYDMKETSANIGTIPGGAEWYEQAQTLEKKIIDEQGLDWVKWNADDQTKLDSISGVTISSDVIIETVSKALNQAK